MSKQAMSEKTEERSVEQKAKKQKNKPQRIRRDIVAATINTRKNKERRRATHDRRAAKKRSKWEKHIAIKIIELESLGSKWERRDQKPKHEMKYLLRKIARMRKPA